jgi:hypothetical protein
VPNDKKALWAAVLFFGNMVALPVYWYLYIWREPPSAASAPPSSPTTEPNKEGRTNDQKS